MAYFRPGDLWPDTDGLHINAHGGGMFYQDGTYYWFGEHKIKGRAGNVAMVGVRCYSSRDLANWKNEGVALSVVHDDPDHEIAVGSVIERPKVIHNPQTGQYVMWFHLELKGQGYTAARSGVAVSDTVTGPYRYLESFRPDGQMARDMTLFVDDDGSLGVPPAYHVYASEDNRTMHVSLLSDDYLRPSGRFERIFVGRYMEAPALFRHRGRIYFIGSGCTGWAPNAARSAVAESIWGPWQELGNPCVGPDAELTFHSQSTYVLPVAGKPGAFIFMADRWMPENAIDGRYVWLPVHFESGRIVLKWIDEWNLDIFEKPGF
ncbi:MAG: family 43 glycosylhydrolase [Anaerolineae bacterium]|nr:family 43 glycosylhydrolase [Anaerolineae bacterium]